MGFREVSVVEVREVLRAWLEGQGLRKAAERAGVDRKTARRYVEAAQAAGLSRNQAAAGVPVEGLVTDELIGLVVEAVRPARPGGHGAAWETLLGYEEQIRAWVSGSEHGGVKHDPLSIVKIEQLRPGRSVLGPPRASPRDHHSRPQSARRGSGRSLVGGFITVNLTARLWFRRERAVRQNRPVVAELRHAGDLHLPVPVNSGMPGYVPCTGANRGARTG